MENRKEILQSLEDLKKRAHELKTPEEIAKVVAGMPITGDLRFHLYENLVEEGFISAPVPATGWIGFSPEKAIEWVVREIENEIGEE